MEPSHRRDPAAASALQPLTYQTPAKTSLLAHPLVRRLHRIGNWLFFAGFAEVLLFIWFGRYLHNVLPQAALPIVPAIGVAAIILGVLCVSPLVCIKIFYRFRRV